MSKRLEVIFWYGSLLDIFLVSYTKQFIYGKSLLSQARWFRGNETSQQERHTPQNTHPDGDGRQHVLRPPGDDGCDGACEELSFVDRDGEIDALLAFVGDVTQRS